MRLRMVDSTGQSLPGSTKAVFPSFCENIYSSCGTRILFLTSRTHMQMLIQMSRSEEVDYQE